MKVEDIKINQLIEIEVEFNSFSQYLPSRVEGIDDKYLHIAAPIYKGGIVPLRGNQEIKVCFIYEGNFFVFYTKIVDRKREPIPLLIVEKPRKLNKIQRRGFVRLPVRLPFYFKVLPDGEEFEESMTLDISGGGVKFITSTSLHTDQLLEIELGLLEGAPICCKARVVRVANHDGENERGFEVAVEYEDITEGQRDRIFAYIFAVQRKWLKKGLLD